MDYDLCTRTHGNVFLHFSFVSSNELLVLDSLENSKQYKNAGKRFRVYGAKTCEFHGHKSMKVFGTKLNMAASDEVDVVFNQTLTTKAKK